MEELAVLNPYYYESKINLVRAEIAAISGRHDVAHGPYVTAAALFESQQSLVDLAITKELMGRYTMKRALSAKRTGKRYLKESMVAF
jgi:hypothetical protein